MKTKAELIFECPVAIKRAIDRKQVEAINHTQSAHAPWRFNEMQRNLEGISQKVLTIVCGLWRRTVLLPHNFSRSSAKSGIYSVGVGRVNAPILDSMQVWGVRIIEQ